MKPALLFTLLLFSCTNMKKESSTETNAPATTETAVIPETKPIETKRVEEEPLVADTGQTWFKVSVTRNDSSYINYEGTWPVYMTIEGFATLAFTASKGALVISHGLTLYIKGLNSGRMSVVRSEREKGQVSMIFIPEVDGAYSLPVSPDSGYIEFTKNDRKVISGHFDAHSSKEYKDIYRFRGQFLNVKPR